MAGFSAPICWASVAFSTTSDSHRFGVKLSDETRRRMSVSKMGDRHPKFIGYYDVDGERFMSINAVARRFGVRPGVVKKRIGSEEYPGWRFIPK